MSGINSTTISFFTQYVLKMPPGSVKLWAMFVLCRLVEEEPVEAATKATLLKQAIEDCFIGRHLTFGIKVQVQSLVWF